ncbi:MAG: BON domain-containing protein [Thermoanaerobaculia bacterium]|nr:BON domain-containing protein [Thermoanaerobaculia bacterium]
MKTLLVALIATILTVAFAGNTAAAPSPVEVETKLSAKLVDAFGDDALTIRVTYFDGNAILTGKVVERSTQELAEQVALYFYEVSKVDNQLRAEKDRKLMDGQLQDEGLDAMLESEAKAALAGEIGSHAKDVNVEAVDGVVAVRGTVPDEARRKLAIDALAKLARISKVIDLLRVK